jgi:G:T-mismatch repair DNA endonuclease (very short patch repair protein)
MTFQKGKDNPMHNPEIVKKVSDKLKGKTSWNKGRKGLQVAWNKGLKGIHLNPKYEFKKGSIPWNKNKKGFQEAWNKDKKGIHLSIKTEFKKGQVPWNKGKTKKEFPQLSNSGMRKEKFTDEIKQKIRIARLNQKFPYRYTNIECKIYDNLKNKDISFIPQKNILNLTQVDAFIEPNICIYCDGDYWHANPLIYDYNNLDNNQKWHVERDKRNNKILNEKGFVVLRFWEKEIKGNISSCIEKIYLSIERSNNETV